jgi:hypothetical protein
VHEKNISKSGTVIVRLAGGLGNNLFQYAAGKYLSDRLKLPLTLETSFLSKNVKDFEILLSLNSSEIANKSNSAKLISSILRINLIERIFFKLGRSSRIAQELFYRIFKIYFSNEFGYDYRLDKIKNSVTIMGYFQSWRYAKCLIDSQELNSLLLNRSSWYNQTKAKIQLVNPIVIHIRRGDYTNVAETFGLLSYNYYNKALEALPIEFRDKEIWVFSDEIEKAKYLFSENNGHRFHFVDSPKNVSAFEVINLMSFGEVLIIANSSFSYWAAILSKNSKLVIAPTKWFKCLPDPIELLPKDWVRVASDWET